MAKKAIPYKISSPYEQLITAVEDAATDSNTGFVHHKQSLVSCFDCEGGSITFECYLFLEDWKWRAAKSNEKVSIVLHAEEEMSNDASTLMRSTVRVSYFVVKDNKTCLLHTVHFDYGSPQSCHAIFHAQLTDKAVVPPPEESKELNCEFEIEEGPSSCFKNARIPTSDMTLPSVLLCLAADHIGEEFFKELKTKLQGIQAAMPKPNYEALKDSLQVEPSHLRSSHWFAHMQ